MGDRRGRAGAGKGASFRRLAALIAHQSGRFGTATERFAVDRGSQGILNRFHSGSREPRWAVPAAVTLVSLFGVLTIAAVSFPPFLLEHSTAVAIQAAPWGPFTVVMEVTNWFADLRQAALAVVVAGALIAFNRRSGFLVLAGIPASAAAHAMKLLVHRPRPPADVVHVMHRETSFGFPSGHATFYAWFIPLVIVALAPWLPNWGRRIAYLVGILVIVFGALGRVWSGAHWPTDVVAGTCLGGGWAIVVVCLIGTPNRRQLAVEVKAA